MAFTQAALAVAVVLVAALSPRQGQPVLLLPLAGQRGEMLSALTGMGLSLVGTGRLSGTLVVYHAEKFPFLAVLQRGFLPISAPVVLCSTDKAGA